jgi:hypothetical protein
MKGAAHGQILAPSKACTRRDARGPQIYGTDPKSNTCYVWRVLLKTEIEQKIYD